MMFLNLETMEWLFKSECVWLVLIFLILFIIAGLFLVSRIDKWEANPHHPWSRFNNKLESWFNRVKKKVFGGSKSKPPDV